jgi:hypothetical protein
MFSWGADFKGLEVEESWGALRLSVGKGRKIIKQELHDRLYLKDAWT